MALSPEEKARRARERMLAKAKEYSTSTYISKFVATVFQEMVRAEYGAEPHCDVWAVYEGELTLIERSVGFCVCVTCGWIGPWKSTEDDIRRIEAGHFIGGRTNAIVFEESGIAPQCTRCNRHGHGMLAEYRKWMEYVRGLGAIERLERLRHTRRSFTRDELVDMRIAYKARLNDAIDRMEELV